jgi:pimeloyl-ACP methyl ester carboxylesterase
MTERQPILDHEGERVTHGKKRVNDVRLHYYTAGSGDPVVLLHGVPKTAYYWRKVVPLLTEDYEVVVPDLRGFGDSEMTRGGHDMETMGDDVAQLMRKLGHDQYHVVGEDWGATTGLALAGQYPDRVETLSFLEMIMDGFGLQEWSFLTEENVGNQRWLWHINFYAVPDFPELLISGNEREYFEHFFKVECHNPAAVPDHAVEEYVRSFSQPGGLQNMLQVYRNPFKNAKFFEGMTEDKLEIPALAVGSTHFIGEEVETQMEYVAEDVTGVTLDWGHQLAEECPEELVDELREFIG